MGISNVTRHARAENGFRITSSAAKQWLVVIAETAENDPALGLFEDCLAGTLELRAAFRRKMREAARAIRASKKGRRRCQG